VSSTAHRRLGLVAAGLLVAILAVFGPLPAQQPVEHFSIPESEGGGADFTACTGCHSDKTEAPVVHAAVGMGCGTCHQVENGEKTATVSLTLPAADLCGTCHEVMEGKLHGPYQQGQCVTCHDPHASEFPFLARAAGNQLCLECHIDRPRQNGPVSVFEVSEIPGEEFGRIPKIGLNRTRQLGHPFLGHPVFGPVDPWREGEPLTCQTCHAPHASPLPRLLDDRWSTVDVCDQCHDAVKQAAKRAKK